MTVRLRKFPFNMVLFGPPGVGKGIYCGMLEKHFSIEAFSTGNFIRSLMKSKSTKNKYFS
jgi:adenylate kinase family enzyme